METSRFRPRPNGLGQKRAALPDGLHLLHNLLHTRGTPMKMVGRAFFSESVSVPFKHRAAQSGWPQQ